MRVIECVEYSRIQRFGKEGVQISFILQNDHIDIFEFFDQEDIEHMVGLMAEGIQPEGLMLAIRQRMNLTVH